MGDISKTFRLLDGGLTRALDSAAAEQAALASPPRPLRSPAALNVLGHNDVLARRPGTGVIVPSPDPLAPVWFISDFASWSLNSLYPFGDLLLITETDPDDTDEVLLDWPTVTGRDYTPRTWPPRRGTPTAPPSFQLLSPVHGATCLVRAPQFRWSACPGATAYRLYIHTSSRLPYTQAGALDVNALTHRATFTAGITSYTPTNPNLLNDFTTYYVWVYAVLDGNKLTRALATPFKFTTKLPAPTGLTTGAFSTLTPTLTWDVNSASGWVVQIKLGATVIHTSAVRTSATYTVPPNLLVAGNTYTYTVTARDVAQGTPGCEVTSAPANFFTEVVYSTKCVAHMRSGANGASGDWEIGLGLSTNNITNHAQVAWPNNSFVDWSLSYSGPGGTLTLTVANIAVYWTPDSAIPNDAGKWRLLLELYASDEYTSQIATEQVALAIDGQTHPIADMLATSGASNSTSIQPHQLGNQVWIITGSIGLGWSGTYPEGSRLQAILRLQRQTP
jgi:hypothetical protein